MTQTELFVKMILNQWNSSILQFDALLHDLSDDALQKEIAPGKNRGIYLLGHLIAVHDEMLIFLDMGEMQYPELHEPFIKNPDKATPHIPSPAELRSVWEKQCEYLRQKLNAVRPDAWFARHTAVSAEDFVNEPHRNKLNIIVSRTSHLQYHTGQLRLLK